jgi:hypothetical protein
MKLERNLILEWGVLKQGLYYKTLVQPPSILYFNKLECLSLSESSTLGIIFSDEASKKPTLRLESHNPGQVL